MFRFTLLSALIASIAAKNITLPPGFTQCGNSNDTLSLHNITITPFPPVAGQNVSIYVEGELKKEIVNGSEFTIDIVIQDVPIYSQTIDLCSVAPTLLNETCPIKAQNFTLNGTLWIPVDIPPIAFNGTLLAINGPLGAENITCLTAPLQFVGGNGQEFPDLIDTETDPIPVETVVIIPEPTEEPGYEWIDTKPLPKPNPIPVETDTVPEPTEEPEYGPIDDTVPEPTEDPVPEPCPTKEAHHHHHHHGHHDYKEEEEEEEVYATETETVEETAEETPVEETSVQTPVEETSVETPVEETAVIAPTNVPARRLAVRRRL